MTPSETVIFQLRETFPFATTSVINGRGLCDDEDEGVAKKEKEGCGQLGKKKPAPSFWIAMELAQHSQFVLLNN